MSAVLKESPLTLEMIESEEHPAPVVQRAGNVVAMPQPGPMGSALAFLQAGGTTEQMREILALQREWEAGEARKAYVQAMTDFKSEPLEIFKRKAVGFTTTDGGFVGYKHAELSDIADVVVPAMARHGLSHRWDVQQGNGRVNVICTVTHRLGHSESVTMDGAPDNSGKKNAIQQLASTVTYLQRYTLLAATGLSTKNEVDDDGAGGAGGQKRDDKRGAPENTPHDDQGAPAYPQEGFDKNLVAWRQLIETGKKTADQILATLATKGQPTDEQARVLRSFKKAA